MRATLSSNIDLPLPPEQVFDILLDELSLALERNGITLEAKRDGRLRLDGREVGRVVACEPGKMLSVRWNPVEWNAQATNEIDLRVEPVEGGTHATIDLCGTDALIADPRELAGWFASEVVAPLLGATTPHRLGDWITDRRARRPSGAAARGVYREPLYHYPNFKVILAELALTPDDHLIEIGCGGGALLGEALESGCRAAGVDHSLDMVRVARQANADAIAAGRLVIEHASADHLPFADATFTCAAMTGVLGFLPDALAALRELRRVLRSGGRIVVFGADPAMRGTPAAPEPIASRLRFYTDEQLKQLGIDAGFDQVRVVRRDLLQYAREVGVPPEHLGLFAAGAPFLLASKGSG